MDTALTRMQTRSMATNSSPEPNTPETNPNDNRDTPATGNHIRTRQQRLASLRSSTTRSQTNVVPIPIDNSQPQEMRSPDKTSRKRRIAPSQNTNFATRPSPSTQTSQDNTNTQAETLHRNKRQRGTAPSTDTPAATVSELEENYSKRPTTHSPSNRSDDESSWHSESSSDNDSIDQEELSEYEAEQSDYEDSDISEEQESDDSENDDLDSDDASSHSSEHESQLLSEEAEEEGETADSHLKTRLTSRTKAILDTSDEEDEATNDSDDEADAEYGLQIESLNRNDFIRSSGANEANAENQWQNICTQIKSTINVLKSIDRSAITSKVDDIIRNDAVSPELKIQLINAAHDYKTSLTEYLERLEEQSEAGQDTLPTDPLELEAFFEVKKVYDEALQEAESKARNSHAQQVGSTGAVKTNPDQITVRFNDVAGVDNAKDALMELVDFLKSPEKYRNIGAKIPKGILLEGPPGTGKTLLAKALAGEAGVPFYSVAGSSFVEVYVGTGASRIRELFADAKKNTPSIVFIDEIDAIGRKRGNGGDDNQEQEHALLQLLTEMDGFGGDTGVIVIAATNRKDVLDDALIRAGRFDQTVTVNNPMIEGRRKILQVHLAHIKHTLTEEDINLLSKATMGCSGAELADIVNKAATLAARHNKLSADISDFEEARDVSHMGKPNRSLKFSEQERIGTSYHESGHTLVAALMEHQEPLHKVTILPRANALGLTWTMSENDEVSKYHNQLLGDICMTLGGYAAEELIYGKDRVSTGIENDLERVSRLAYNMVSKWGFSEKIGKIAYADPRDHGSHLPRPSEATRELIDQEAKRIVDECYQKTKQLLIDNRDKLVV